jgi:hypothetical protein
MDIHATYHASIYTSTNHIPFLIPSILTGAIIIGFGFYILPYYGLIGILLVRFIAQLSFNGWYSTYLSLRFLRWPLLDYISDVPSNGIRYMSAKIKEFNPFT